MRCEINGEAAELSDGLTVAKLLEERELEPREVAIEVNRELVPRAGFGERKLVEGDRIEIVRFVGGG